MTGQKWLRDGHDITAKRLKKIVHYDPDTGIFVRVRNPERRADISTKKKGSYRCVCVESRVYMAHRLAWFYMTGGWPAQLIDHINGDARDNRWSNLRAATFAENQQNKGPNSNNSTGIKGVFLYRYGEEKQYSCFRAHIEHKGKKYYLGSFKTVEEAAQARTDAEKRLFTHSRGA